MQQRHLSSRPVNRFRWTSRIWVMRPVGAVRMKQSEKTPAALVRILASKSDPIQPQRASRLKLFSPSQSSMTWRCAHLCPIIRTVRG